MARRSITKDAFRIGFQHGEMTGQHVSPREVSNWSPGWDAAEIEAYLNGRDDGVAGDRTRIDRM